MFLQLWMLNYDLLHWFLFHIGTGSVSKLHGGYFFFIVKLTEKISGYCFKVMTFHDSKCLKLKMQCFYSLVLFFTIICWLEHGQKVTDFFAVRPCKKIFPAPHSKDIWWHYPTRGLQFSKKDFFTIILLCHTLLSRDSEYPPYSDYHFSWTRNFWMRIWFWCLEQILAVNPYFKKNIYHAL